MAYEDLYKGLTEKEKEKLIKMDVPKFVSIGNEEVTKEEKLRVEKYLEKYFKAKDEYKNGQK